MILQRKPILREVKAIETVADVLPINKVFRVQDNESWHRVHSSASQIVVITHPNNIGVGEFVIEQGIGKRAVAIICRPTLCGSGAS